MKLYIKALLKSSLEWEQAPSEIKQQFEDYLEDFFKEHTDRMDVPLTFVEWLKQNNKFDIDNSELFDKATGKTVADIDRR